MISKPGNKLRSEEDEYSKLEILFLILVKLASLLSWRFINMSFSSEIKLEHVVLSPFWISKTASLNLYGPYLIQSSS